MALDILTFGCRLNSFESEVMRREAAAAGLEDAVLVNTCAVTGEAVRQARQAIRKARRENPNARIVVTGCAAQTDPKLFADMAEVDLVLGNAEKLEASSYAPAADAASAVRVADAELLGHRTLLPIEGIEGRARAFVQVQNGCDHACTFCVIPQGRGPSRSVPVAEVVAQARRLVGNGYRELVLTGVDLTSWGADLAGHPVLGDLVAALLSQVPELARLRLSSIDAVEVDPRLMRLIAEEERLLPHLHLSLQAGDDMILKRMKRRHGRADAVHFCEEVRRLRPDMVFGADLIAGFPTETDAMFENSLRLVEDCGLTFLHVFPFSPRPGTPAAKMPQLDRGLVKARAARLREAGGAAFIRHLDGEIGARRLILVEREGIGRTERFTPSEIVGGQPGEIIAARIVGRTQSSLIAEAA
ncbi:MAG TPA: tRNA (N(6)-L-threonylcarbamoyladenosine(37)-C(2))-methylthiotransferase MtaB [Kaistiaceae bacterium]|nr:tRNA (N(6)-L-threonylcarbamoyladenosine(37)-C(2))-methylthiotransferase MtaB [Kaistiaceae bacterium]